MLTQLMARANMKPLTIDLVCGSLLLIAVGALGWFAYRPLLQAASLLELGMAEDKKLLNRSSEITAEHTSFSRQLADKQQLLEGLEERVPFHPQESEFFGQVVELSNQHGVQIHGFRPGSPVALKDYFMVKTEFDASGEYQPLCHFLHGLAKLRRLNHITRMHVAPKSPESEVLSVKIEAQIYFAARAVKTEDRS